MPSHFTSDNCAWSAMKVVTYNLQQHWCEEWNLTLWYSSKVNACEAMIVHCEVNFPRTMFENELPMTFWRCSESELPLSVHVTPSLFQRSSCLCNRGKNAHPNVQTSKDWFLKSDQSGGPFPLSGDLWAEVNVLQIESRERRLSPTWWSWIIIVQNTFSRSWNSLWSESLKTSNFKFDEGYRSL